MPMKLSTLLEIVKFRPGYAWIICLMLVIPVADAQDSAPEAQADAETAIQSSSSSSAEVPLYPNRNIRDKTLIAQAAGEQAQWLESEYGKLLAFYRPTEARETRGVLVLFHAAEDPQAWPPILENLRANLPRFGWETLAITLPQRYPGPVPRRVSSTSSSLADETGADAGDPTDGVQTAAETPEVAAQSSASVSSVPLISREELIAAYVKAAFDFLTEKAQLNAVLLVDNSSASPVLNHLLPQVQENSENPDTLDGPIQALIITNLQSQEPLSTGELTAIFGNPKLPVLDVFFTPDSLEQKQARERHRALAMRQKLEIYQQAGLDGQPKIVETDPRSFLAARVRGFMQRHADGSETEKEKGQALKNQ